MGRVAYSPTLKEKLPAPAPKLTPQMCRSNAREQHGPDDFGICLILKVLCAARDFYPKRESAECVRINSSDTVTNLIDVTGEMLGFVVRVLKAIVNDLL